MDRGDCWTTVHGVSESQTQLSTQHTAHSFIYSPSSVKTAHDPLCLSLSFLSTAEEPHGHTGACVAWGGDQEI